MSASQRKGKPSSNKPSPPASPGQQQPGEGAACFPEPAKSRSNSLTWKRRPSLKSLTSGRAASMSKDGAGNNPELVRRDFSLKRYRNASDPQLSTRFYEQRTIINPDSSDEEAAPAPVIGITNPIWDAVYAEERQKRRFRPFASPNQSFRSKSMNLVRQTSQPTSVSSTPNPPSKVKPKPSLDRNVSFDRASRPSESKSAQTAFQHQEDDPSFLAVPRPSSSTTASDRPSHDGSAGTERSRKKQSNNIFKFRRRRKKEPDSLFPLPAKPSSQPASSENLSAPGSSTIPVVRRSQNSPNASTPVNPAAGWLRKSFQSDRSDKVPPPLSPSQAGSFTSSPLNPATPQLQRKLSATSVPALATDPEMPKTFRSFRSRSNTTSSKRSRGAHQDDGSGSVTPDVDLPGRNSTNTASIGRNSVMGLRTLTSKLRLATESHGDASPAGGVSSPNESSYALHLQSFATPERMDGESPVEYYGRLQKDMPKKGMAIVLSKSNDPFSHDVLRSLTRTFMFFEEPLDMSLRKFLWEIGLPTEAQQIDRVLQAFSERYHECNGGVFKSADEAYFVAYSLLILHSDLFNKNNKKKMQRHEYQKNTRDQGVDEEILGYFYDNIQWTEFISMDPDEGEEGSNARARSRKARKKLPRSLSTDQVEDGKADPYDFVVDNGLKLDVLRPPLADVLDLDDTFNYRGTVPKINLRAVRTAFSQPGKLPVISSRSRPEAFASPATIKNPNESHPGVVRVQIVKVGVLWRKDTVKKKTRSPWQQWGAVLTSSKLSFFKNVGWARSLMDQVEKHRRTGGGTSGLVFSPPIENFAGDAVKLMYQSVALYDTAYEKHKYGFILANHKDHEDEVLRAESEAEMNDWLAKINYAATFATLMIPLQSISQDTSDALKNRASVDRSLNGESHSISDADKESETRIERAKSRDIGKGFEDRVKTGLKATEQALPDARLDLEGNLRAARHLTLLTPFPTKTRANLLQFGAKLGHKLRYSYFEVWRLLCAREILLYELRKDRDESGKDEGSAAESDGVRARSSTKTRPLIRLNSKATSFIGKPMRSKKNKERRGPPSGALQALANESLGEEIDRALATPDDTDAKTETDENRMSWVPPSTLGSGGASVNSDTFDRPASPGTDTADEQEGNIKASNASETPDSPQVRPSSSSGGLLEHAVTEQTEGLAASTVSEKESSAVQVTGENKSGVGRSLPRTMRSQNQKHRRGKGSLSSQGGTDSAAGSDTEGISRGTGSITLHGKKASVVKFGKDWDNNPEEELRRVRKQLQGWEPQAGETNGEPSNSAAIPEIRRIPPSSDTESMASTYSLREPIPVASSADGGIELLGGGGVVARKDSSFSRASTDGHTDDERSTTANEDDNEENDQREAK